MAAAPRIALIHALKESQVPIWQAFAALWPEARLMNLLDDSLSTDLADAGALTDAIIELFLILGRYARDTGADAILFTCSAFGRAIAAVKAEHSIPVLTPNEAAFAEAIAVGPRVGLVVTFPPSLKALSEELRAMSARMQLKAVIADGALAALQAGEPERHDQLILRSVDTLTASCDAVVLGQFSMARAARGYTGPRPLFTTPESAVSKLRQHFP